MGAGLAVVQDGKLLLYRRRKPPEANSWNILGGKIDHMETALSAAFRKAEEESGIRVLEARLLCHSEQILPADAQHWVSLIYVATALEGEPRLAEPDKFHGFGWFPLDQLPQPLSRFAADAVAALTAQRYVARNPAS